MYLVFVRHGKAEYGYDDYTRKLTEEGRAALRKFFPKLESRLRESIVDFDKKSKSILTSPKSRALETAELLAEHLSLLEIEETDTLMNYSLASALREARQTNSDLVFLVGHDPMCSVWVLELCQEDILFRKGAAALVDYSKPNEVVKPLIWYISPEKSD